MKKYIKKLVSFCFPKIVIAFRQNGCMGTQYEFLYIGYVVKEYDKPKDSPARGLHIYAVQPLVKGSQEHREKKIETEEAYQLSYLGMNLYIHYK